MVNPQDQTIKTYRDKFSVYAEKTVNEVLGDAKQWIDNFSSRLPPNASIFEMGSATGRDARYLRNKGFKVFCTDVVPEALQVLKDDGFNTSEFDFRNNIKPEWGNSFDGFFANGVLLHASKQEFLHVLDQILFLLKEKRIAAFSLKSGTGEKISMHKMDSPRFFQFYSKEELQTILAKYNFTILSLDLIDENKWLTVILQKN